HADGRRVLVPAEPLDTGARRPIGVRRNGEAERQHRERATDGGAADPRITPQVSQPSPGPLYPNAPPPSRRPGTPGPTPRTPPAAAPADPPPPPRRDRSAPGRNSSARPAGNAATSWRSGVVATSNSRGSGFTANVPRSLPPCDTR